MPPRISATPPEPGAAADPGTASSRRATSCSASSSIARVVGVMIPCRIASAMLTSSRRASWRAASFGRQESRRLPAGVAQRGVHRLREIREFARREQVPEDMREHLGLERVAAHELAVRAHCGTAIVVARAAEMPRAGAVVLHHVVPAAPAAHAEAGEQELRPGAPRPEPARRGRGQMTNVFVAGGTGVLGALVGSRPAADEFGVRLRSISVTACCHS